MGALSGSRLTEAELDLQRRVRGFLDEEVAQGWIEGGLGMEGGRDPAFSRRLAAHGWVGMSVPPQYGGAGHSAVDRFVVAEELLRRGAPVVHHWCADRQTAPMLLRFGTEDQKERLLPRICRGELAFCIGMSEPDAGSDLAAVRTRAVRTDGGWLLDGSKIWTSGAAESDYMVVLCRTDPAAERHQGLSQLIVDLTTPGLLVHPIAFLTGAHSFATVVFDGVFVPDGMVLGAVGEGWAQNTSELSYERGGPDRWLSTYMLVETFLREHAAALTDDALEVLGRLAAQYWGIRRLSLGVARSVDRGEAPVSTAAMVKEMGTRFEQEVVTAMQQLSTASPLSDSTSTFGQLLFRATLEAPSYTIRGGTTEILRSVAARELR